MMMQGWGGSERLGGGGRERENVRERAGRIRKMQNVGKL
jgi:hypothetical protein